MISRLLWSKNDHLLTIIVLGKLIVAVFDPWWWRDPIHFTRVFGSNPSNPKKKHGKEMSTSTYYRLGYSSGIATLATPRYYRLNHTFLELPFLEPCDFWARDHLLRSKSRNLSPLAALGEPHPMFRVSCKEMGHFPMAPRFLITRPLGHIGRPWNLRSILRRSAGKTSWKCWENQKAHFQNS